ncbi:MAG: hypothetical protein JWO08_1987 [Verrucomicrobiaceae bacterium]|nr:hypothetical protein [Verrucomicrobiaceae bacterium]
MVLAVADLIIEFLRGIGLSVQERTLTIDTILPGITVDRGGLIIDRAQMTYPGDLLHEAGHLAIMPKAERDGLSVNVGADPGYEMGAIAWSYAAAVHLGLPAEVVFHDAGYKAGASALRENFAEGRYIGVPILQWRGLADAPGSATGYPAMKQWLCE